MKYYLGIFIQLHGCFEDPDTLVKEIREWLVNKLRPEFESDIDVTMEESSP